MRQAIIVVALFCIFLFVLQQFTSNLSVRVNPESFIAQDVLVVGKQYDLEENLNAFRASPLGLALTGIDYPGVARELEMPEADIEKMVSIQKEIERTSNDPLVKILFGKEVTIALFPFGELAVDSSQPELINNVLLISRPKHYAKLVDIASQIMAKKAQITESHYGGYVIKRFPVNEHQTLAAVRVKNLLLFSYNERLLRRSLDTYDTTGKAQLIDLPEYKETLPYYKHSSFFSYINIPGLSLTIGRSIESSEVEEKGFVLSQLSDIAGYKSLFLGKERKNNQIVDKVIITYDRDGIKPEYRELFDIEPIEENSFYRVSSDTIWYYWTNGLRPKTMLNLYQNKRRLTETSSRHDFLSELAGITEIPTDDLISLIKNNITIAIQDIPAQQFIPVPRFMIGIKTEDSKELKSALEKILQHYGIPINTKTVQGVDINSWGGIIGNGDVLPSFAFVGEYLVIASNKEQIKEFIALPDKNKSLGKSSLFKSIENGIAGKNNSIGYLQFAKVTNMIKEIVSWGGTMIAIKDREAARKSKVLIDHLINPILDGLSMFSAIGTRSYFEDGKIFIESTTIVAEKKK